MRRFFSMVTVGGLTAASLLTAVPVGASTPRGTGSCPGGEWPAETAGTPTDAHPGMTGLALWRDGDVWHLRASQAGADRAVFAGKIETDGVIKYVRRHLEGGDVTARAGRHDIAYRFTNYGRVDGIDFTVKCGAHLEIAALLDGHPVTVEQVVIGRTNAHPAAVPVILDKSGGA